MPLFIECKQFMTNERSLSTIALFCAIQIHNNMKKLLLLSSILFGAICSASAQYYYHNDNAQQFGLGIGVSSGLATGPVSSAFPESGGLIVRLNVPINKSPVSFIAQTGWTFFVSNSGYGVDFGPYGYGASTYYYGDIASFIPVEAGLKAYVAPRFFLEGELGASFNVNTYTSDYTNKATDFIYAGGVGYSFGYGLDLSLQYENRPEPGGGYSQVALRGVWNFGFGRHSRF